MYCRDKEEAAGERCLAVDNRQIGHMARRAPVAGHTLRRSVLPGCRAGQSRDCSPSTGGSAFASRSVPSSSSWSLGSRSYSLEQGTCRFASARSYMMVECYYLLGSASSRRLVWAASRCKLSLRPGGLYQVLLLLTRACSRSARAQEVKGVSQLVSLMIEPALSNSLTTRRYFRHART